LEPNRTRYNLIFFSSKDPEPEPEPEPEGSILFGTGTILEEAEEEEEEGNFWSSNRAEQLSYRLAILCIL
jgi:hypothetical protein